MYDTTLALYAGKASFSCYRFSSFVKNLSGDNVFVFDLIWIYFCQILHEVFEFFWVPCYPVRFFVSKSSRL